MPRTGRPLPALVLTEDERATLQRWARRPKSAQALALRAKIVLACADGGVNKEVAARFGVTPQMAGKWRARFVTDRLGGLTDSERSGRPRTVTDEQVEQGGAAPPGQAPPGGGTHWAAPVMAPPTGPSQTPGAR